MLAWARYWAAAKRKDMKIAKPLLLVTTPIGLAGGIYEAFRLAGGLAFIMVALVLMISAAMAMLVMTIRKEKRAEEAALRATSAAAAANPFE